MADIIPVLQEKMQDPQYEKLFALPDAECVAAIKAETITVVSSRFVNERTVMAEWGDTTAAEAFLQTLEAIALQNPIIKRAVSWMTPNMDGIDAGHEGTRNMMLYLASVGAVTAADAAKFNSLAETKTSLAAQWGILPSADHIAIARGASR